MDRVKTKIRSSLNREERRAKKREARVAQELDNQRRLEKMKEATCAYCGNKVGAHDAIRIRENEKACLGCIERYSKEKIEQNLDRLDASRDRRERFKRCANCSKEQENHNFGSFWTGRDYVDVCKTCIGTYGETELRDELLYHRGTAPIMNGGLPTLGKKR